MDSKVAELFLGKNVRIYPDDTNSKTGEVVDVNDHGVTFKITTYNGSDERYVVGKLHYIAFSARLSMSEI